LRHLAFAALAAFSLGPLAAFPATAQPTQIPQICGANRINGGLPARVTITFRSPQWQRIGVYFQPVSPGARGCYGQAGAYYAEVSWEIQRNGRWLAGCQVTISEVNRDRVVALQGDPANATCSVGWQ
jgi:hypothetical protein